MDQAQGALTQLRAFLAQYEHPVGTRLPPERDMVDLLGVSRGELRKALAIMASNGEVWRHVGKGTFVGARPVEELSTIATIAGRTNPREVMRARLLIEPQIAREAALNASASDIAAMRQCVSASRTVQTWRHYENWDNRLHRTLAEASHNTVLVALFDTLNGVRRAVAWGRLRAESAGPPADHHSFAQHEDIVGAIEDRDMGSAMRCMERHLVSVQEGLLRASASIDVRAASGIETRRAVGKTRESSG